MNKILCLCLAFILGLGLAIAGDPPLPADVQRVIDQHDKAVADAKAAYDAACAKADAIAVKALDPVIKNHTTKGDLDGAVAAKKVQEGWRPVVKPGDDPLTTLKPIYVGTWNVEKDGGFLTTLTVKADGTALWGSTPGTWKLDDSVLRFSWGNAIDAPTTRHCKVIDHGRGEVAYTVTIAP